MGQRISQLDLAGPLSGAEYFALVQEGKTKKVQASSFSQVISSSCKCTLVSRGNSVAAPDDVFQEYLQTWQMPANTLRAVGDWIEIISFGSFGVNTNVKNLFVKVKDSQDDMASTGAIDETTWTIRSIVMKSSDTELKMTTTFSVNGAAQKSDIDYNEFSANTGTDISISVGSYGLNAASDVIVEGFIIELHQIDVNS